MLTGIAPGTDKHQARACSRMLIFAPTNGCTKNETAPFVPPVPAYPDRLLHLSFGFYLESPGTVYKAI
jgi:hypothetical protein